ncbi:uncharacterized protein LOC142985454 isoform X2 [Anticarsia gemmatalis]|uniref:uncharacterized protein LOC142985454 isoform X2 n=1 Tax=Anticarsia gemmatalis TaxID=129554 RepID=UPI003F76A737
MAKLYTILFLGLLATVYCEEFSSEDARNQEESEEIDHTTHFEDEEEYTTTTANYDDEKVEYRRDEGANETEDDDKGIRERQNTFDRYDSVENSTDEVVDSTVSSLNNDVLIAQSNFTNNIDFVAKTETIPVQTTTRVFEEEQIPRVQDSKEEVETPGPRIPKSDNDPERLYPHVLSPPQSTRSIVRGWLEDTWIRSPIGILVPLRASALNRALAVWTDLNSSALNLSGVCLMGYDENGVSWRSKHNLNPNCYVSHEKTVSEALSKLLLKYQGVNTDSRGDGTMRALIGGAKLVPYDSALFVITDGAAGDAHRLPLALRAVVEKRLKVYTLWTDPNYPGSEDEEGLEALRNISKHTEGEVIPYPLQDVDGSSNLAGEAELEQWNPSDPKLGRRGKLNPEVEVEKFDLLVVRRGGGQAISLGVPVENGVTALRIFIEGAVEHAVLYPPNDAPQIDLYNATSVAMFSPASKTAGMSPRDVYLVFPGSQLDMDTLAVLPASQPRQENQAFVGMWHLSVRCDTCDYRLCVSARAQIHFDVESDNPASLKFRVTGPVASVRESQLVDEYGTELAKLSFSYQPMAGDGQSREVDPIVELVAEVAIPPVKGSKVYSKIVGRDLRGEPFIRLTGPLTQPEVRMGRSASIAFPDSTNDLERAEEFNSMMYSQLQFNDSQQPFSRVAQVVNQQGSLLTSLQIGLASKLYGSPGDNLQLHFEVTNYREQTVRCTFGAVGELRFLSGITPGAQNIAPGQTVNVIVSITIPSTVQPGARDLITFTAYGNEQISMSAYVYVTNPGDTTDVWAPEVRHTFQGTCLGRTGDDCAQHAWSATIIARDGISGLLRLSSSPIGLLYNGEFISGTRQEVTATYRATCCAPRVLLNAVDANGNANSYIIDISGYLTEAAIAAIVLGVFLAIALIVLLIFLIYWCVKKRRESRELPTYNTRS